MIRFLTHKGETHTKRVVTQSDAARKEHGVDLHVRLENEKKRGNSYFIEAKGNLRADGTPMLSSRNTNFRWALSQIILRIKVDSTKNNYIYGIAMPLSDVQACAGMIRDNWALKLLKIRLYGAYRDKNGQLTAKEFLPQELYD